MAREPQLLRAIAAVNEHVGGAHNVLGFALDGGEFEERVGDGFERSSASFVSRHATDLNGPTGKRRSVPGG